MIITPDFSAAAESQNQPIQPGVYKARVAAVEEKTSQAGNAYLNWKLEIFGAEGDMAQANNRPVFYRTMTSGKGAGMLRDFLKATLGSVPQGQFNTDEIFGKEVEILLAEGRKQDGTPSDWPEVKRVKQVTT